MQNSSQSGVEQVRLVEGRGFGATGKETRTLVGQQKLLVLYSSRLRCQSALSEEALVGACRTNQSRAKPVSYSVAHL